MSNTVGALNVLLGCVYTSYGLMTVMDMRQNWRTRGFSHFGLAWILMAFTCGPHHLEHGLHVLTDDRIGGIMDFGAVMVGLPAGIIWFLLRLEAVAGGRGDRFVAGLPAWVESLPTMAGIYAVGLITAALPLVDDATFDTRLLPNMALVVLYIAIGWVLFRTQLANHRVLGGWSISGLSLGIVFPTCALMHGVWALYASAGRYDIDGHLLTIDVLAVPAAAYFLWVVWSLHRGSISDWTADTDTRVVTVDDDLRTVVVST